MAETKKTETASKQEPTAAATNKPTTAKEAPAAPKAAKGAEKKDAKGTDKKDAKGTDKKDAKATAKDDQHTPRLKPEVGQDVKDALGLRRDKKARTPVFRRHEWWRYKDLGGKNAAWRRPRGIHSKQRRHFGWRPPVVSVGYRGPAAARGLHPSGFEEVLVHRPADLDALDPKTQAARVGRTVGGRKAEAIEAAAGKLGIRVLNPRGES